MLLVEMQHDAAFVESNLVTSGKLNICLLLSLAIPLLGLEFPETEALASKNAGTRTLKHYL